MSYDNFTAFPAASAATANVTGTTASAVSGQRTISVEAIATGAPVGSIQIQTSNDPVSSPAQVVNWNSPTGAYALAISAAGISRTSVPDFCARWFRVNYVFTSGTGTITANVMVVGQ